MNARILLAFALLGIVATLASAGATSGIQPYQASAASQTEDPNNVTRTVSVTGMSSAKVSPDRVAISFAVENQEKTAQHATQANANVSTNVIEALTNAGVSESEIGTSYYNVYPVYEYISASAECFEYEDGGQVQKYCPPPTQKQVLVGYKAVNGITVESAQFDMAGQWIDAAVAAGANRVDYLYFSLSSQKQDEIRNTLIAQAVQDARHKAEIAITPLGMSISNVLTVDLNNYPVIVYPKRGYESAAGAPSATTPVIPGIQEVSASVHATFEMSGFDGSQTVANSTASISPNEEFQLALDSNPSTGYQWQVTTIDTTIVRLVNEEYVAPESGLVGAGGKQVLTFEALKEGNTTIVLEYVRPWEPENPASVYSLEVVVSANS